MKNKKQTILIILISVLIILGITAFVLATTINKTKANTGTGEEETIQFNDKNLYNAIKTYLDNAKIEYTANDTNKTLTMTQENINKVEILKLINKEITDITGLETFKNLKTLNLGQNQITDINAISGLTKLQELYLYKNQISDIGALSGLTKLQTLSLWENQISDIGAISGLTKLQTLDLWDNQISDIGALSGLTKLQTLYLWDNQISDIGAISGLTNLQTLSLGENHKISDIGAISGLTNLQTLELWDNQISDIGAISGLTNLQELHLGYNQIIDIGAISGLTNLQELNLRNNQISNIEAISGLTNLKELYLDNNQINKIDAISGLTNLQTLWLDDNQIIDIGALSGLTNLTDLHLYKNQINKIDAISGLTNLQTLVLWGNQISDIDAISGLTNLTDLHLFKNQINKIDAISGLTNLQTLYLDNNQIIDIGAMSGLTNLTYLSLVNNQIIDIGAISGLTNLQELYLSKNQIIDIDAIKNLKKLEKLYLRNNNIEDITPINNMSSLQEYHINNQTINKTITSGREIALPQILIDAKNSSSKAYVGNGIDYQLTNCTISSDGKKVIVNDGETTATVTIEGTGGATGTTLNIEVKCNHTGGYTTKWNETEHWKECNDCQEEIPNTRENHNITNYISNGDETHSGTCTVCKGKLTEACTYNGNTCTKCGATKPNTGCVHNYITQYNETEHWEYCTKCKTELEGSRKNHIYGKILPNGNGTHTKKCTGCPYSKTENCTYVNGKCSECGATKPNTGCVHNYITQYNETEHWEYCTKCKTELEGSRKKHTFGTPTSNGNGTHTKKCTGCSYSKTENCTYVNGKCSECGATKPNTECTHNYEIKYNGVQHYEECTKCKEEKPGSRQNHTYGVATSNENGTHSKKCTGCPYIRIEYCNYINGKCSECGANKPDTECTHNYVPKHNETEHWEECTICRIELEGSRQNHIYGKETSNGNGTHTKKCTVCSYSKTENCTYENGKCSECGATKPDNENPGDGQDNTNNGQNNGNNTNNGNSNNGNSNNGNSGGKPLPQTGTSSIVIIGIIAFTVLGTLTFIRIKKYKLN